MSSNKWIIRTFDDLNLKINKSIVVISIKYNIPISYLPTSWPEKIIYYYCSLIFQKLFNMNK